jgi:hypothetical protein
MITKDLDPRTAQVLAAVLIAAAEQVNGEKLAQFHVSERAELPLLSLAMAFRGDDNGLMGDVFEWCMLSAINLGDSDITQLTSDALRLVGEPISNPQAILVAAEKGRLVEFSPSVPAGAKIMSGRRGRPRLVANALADATTTDWKADVLLGADERWVPASLKVNPTKVLDSVRTSASTRHPLRIGIAPDLPSRAGLTRDPQSGAVIMRVPVDSVLMALTRGVIFDVKEAFARHLSLPQTPLARDISGIGEQLHRWREKSVREVVTTLYEIAEDRYAIDLSEPMLTETTASNATDALIALDPIVPVTMPGRFGSAALAQDRRVADELRTFNPID